MMKLFHRRKRSKSISDNKNTFRTHNVYSSTLSDPSQSPLSDSDTPINIELKLPSPITGHTHMSETGSTRDDEDIKIGSARRNKLIRRILRKTNASSMSADSLTSPNNIVIDKRRLMMVNEKQNSILPTSISVDDAIMMNELYALMRIYHFFTGNDTSFISDIVGVPQLYQKTKDIYGYKPPVEYMPTNMRWKGREVYELSFLVVDDIKRAIFILRKHVDMAINIPKKAKIKMDDISIDKWSYETGAKSKYVKIRTKLITARSNIGTLYRDAKLIWKTDMADNSITAIAYNDV